MPEATPKAAADKRLEEMERREHEVLTLLEEVEARREIQPPAARLFPKVCSLEGSAR